MRNEFNFFKDDTVYDFISNKKFNKKKKTILHPQIKKQLTNHLKEIWQCDNWASKQVNFRFTLQNERSPLERIEKNFALKLIVTQPFTRTWLNYFKLT